MITDEQMGKLLFAHDKVRDSQNSLILKIDEVIKKGKNLVVHAPTGLGKTAAALGPALSYAIDNDKTVFFLTSRHTQHKIAIDTLKKIKERYNLNFDVVDLIGKKWMCPVPGVEKLFSSEFSEYCKSVKENETCEFYSNTKQKTKLSVKAKDAIMQIRQLMPVHSEKMYELCVEQRLCPYEISSILANKARVIVADYFYIFSPSIRDAFFSRSEKLLDDCIVIADEGHNLPSRIKDLATQRISSIMLKRAMQEAKKFGLDELEGCIAKILDILSIYSAELNGGSEKHVSRHDFESKVLKISDFDTLISQLELAAIRIREEKKQSYLGSVASFLEAWRGEDLGFARIFSKTQSRREDILMLSYRCLDPSIISRDVVNDAHSTIVMSGTMTPTDMYGGLLGMEDYETDEFPSPFPQENRLTLIVGGVSTKFSKRSEDEFRKIADKCSEVVNSVPGNSAVFFPSYFLLDKVSAFFDTLTRKTVIKEIPGLTKGEKAELLDNFKRYKDTGAALFGVISGSFGEGIDLPGDYLKCVVIVGLPLGTPDLETKSLIDYYDKKFGKGWEYGYIAPAFNKTLQGAGRCIRSEKDKGVVVFLDERYAWSNYKKYFPNDWEIIESISPKNNIEKFF